MAETDACCSDNRNYKCLPLITSTRELKCSLPLYFHMKHAGCICNALDVIQRDVLLHKPIHWKMLRIVLGSLKVNNKTSIYCLSFAKELVRLLERHQCKDLSVMSEVFLTMFFLTAENLSWYGGIPLVNSISNIEFVRTPYVEIRKLFYTSYGAKGIKLDLVWQVARRGSSGVLKLLLKFGMSMMISSFDATSCSVYIEQLLLLR